MAEAGAQKPKGIEGVLITPLRKIMDERGMINHMLKVTDNHFREFGEIYFSWVHPGAIKAWHLHSKMILNYAAPVGKIKLALYDLRQDSPTRGNLMEIFMGQDDYKLVTVPAGVANGFKGLGTTDSLVANCATMPHDPAEITRIDPFTPDIPYDWNIKHG